MIGSNITEPTQDDLNLVEEVNKQISDLAKKPSMTPTLSNWREDLKQIEEIKSGVDIISKKQEGEVIKELLYDPNDPDTFATIESKTVWEKLGFKNKK